MARRLLMLFAVTLVLLASVWLWQGASWPRGIDRVAPLDDAGAPLAPGVGSPPSTVVGSGAELQREPAAPAPDSTTLRIEVLVRSAAGAPVAGATVHADALLYDPWSAALREFPFGPAAALPTNATGRTSVAPGHTALHALAVGQHGHAAVPPGAERVEIVMQSVPATTVQVRNADGSPAPQVPVVALLSVASMAGLPLARATTDASGNAQFPELGSVVSLAAAQRFKTEAVVFAVDALGVLGVPSAHVRQATAALGGPVLLTMPQLVPMRLEVEAWPDGVDPGTAVVTATDRAGWRHAAAVHSEDRRVFAVNACLGASFAVDLRAPGMVGRGDGHVPDTAPLRPLSVPIQLEHRTVTLTGQVVELREPRLAVQARCGRWRSEYAACDADGRFQIEVPRKDAPSDVTLTVWAATERPLRPKQLAVEPIVRELPLDASVDLGALRFTRQSLQGRVIDQMGRGVAGAKVQIELAQTDASDLDGDGSPINWNMHGRTRVQTDDDGRFEWTEARRGSPRDRFRFRIHAEGFVSAVSEPFPTAGSGEFLLRTQPAGQIEGIVIATSRELLEAASVSFVGPSGLGVRPERRESQAQGGSCQRPIRATGLEPGANRVCIELSLPGLSTTVWAADVLVAAGAAAATIHLDLDRVVRLRSVRVTGADGSPLRAQVFGVGADGKPRAHYALQGVLRVELSDWRDEELTLRAPGHQSRQVRLQHGEEWQLLAQAPTRFTLSAALAAQVTNAKQVLLVLAWRAPHGHEPVAEGSTMLDGGVGTRSLPPGRYSCELLVRAADATISKIPCADIEVSPTLPPGPVPVEVQAAR